MEKARSVLLDVVVGGNTSLKGPDFRVKSMAFEGSVGGRCGSRICQCRRFDFEGAREAAALEQRVKAKGKKDKGKKKDKES
jgi:hypothetical protein